MRRTATVLALLLASSALAACTGVGAGVGVGVYHHHHVGPWFGVGGYYRDRVIVVPPEEIEPEFEATPLPSGPGDMDMPDMGMPDVDLGDF